MLGVSAVASAATIYKWVDANGVVHYSDTPMPGAEPIEIGSIQTYRATPERAGAPGASQSPAAQGPPTCVIDTPAREQVFMNTDDVQGHVSLSRPLQPDQQVVLRLDGRVYTGVVDGGGTFALSAIDRGTHTLTAEVQDADGKPLCTTPAVTFYVRQPSLLSPLNQQGGPRPH
jgi:hypothetical protein